MTRPPTFRKREVVSTRSIEVCVSPSVFFSLLSSLLPPILSSLSFTSPPSLPPSHLPSLPPSSFPLSSLPTHSAQERKEGMLGSSHSWKVNFFAWWWSLRILYWSCEKLLRSGSAAHSAGARFGRPGGPLRSRGGEVGGTKEEVGGGDRNEWRNE